MFEELLSEMTTIELILQSIKIILMIGAGVYGLILLNEINKNLRHLLGEE